MKTINYLGLLIDIGKNGDVIVNGKKRVHYLNADGYPVCSLNIPNVGWRAVGIHRLIALAYIQNPNNLDEVNHKDYDRTNYNPSNLEWITHADNVRYSVCNKPDTSGINNPNYNNRKLSEIYKNNKQYSKEKQGRSGLQNGRCQPIKLYDNGELIAEFEWMKPCCEYMMNNNISTASLEGIRGQINSCIRNNKLYKGRYSFRKM